MKTALFLTVFFVLTGFSCARSQDWSANPTKPSLLLLAEGQAGPSELVRSGIYRQTGTNIGFTLSGLLELPASATSNILIKGAFGHRQDDVATSRMLGPGSFSNYSYSFGFGVRFFWGVK